MRLLASVALLTATIAQAGFTICAPIDGVESECLYRWDCPCPDANGEQGACSYNPGSIQVCGLDYGGGAFACDGNDEPRMMAFDCQPLGQTCIDPNDPCVEAEYELPFAGWTVDENSKPVGPGKPEATCSAEPHENPKCKEHQFCNRQVMCCPQVGDPISVKDDVSTEAITDVTVRTALGPLSFTRYFSSSPYTFAWQGGPAIATAFPFGRSKLHPASVHWTHNWNSAVRFPDFLPDGGAGLPDGRPSYYSLADTSGTIQTFAHCTPPCYAAPQTATSSADEMFYLESGRVTHLRGTMGRFVYETAWGIRRLYLSRWEDSQYDSSGQPRSKAELDYETPSGCDGGPYLARVTASDGVRLELEWEDGGACHLLGVSVGKGSGTPVRAVSYEFDDDAGWMIARKGSGQDAGVEVYSFIPDAGWLVTSNGVQRARHPHTGTLADFGQGDVELYRKGTSSSASCSVTGCELSTQFNWAEYVPLRQHDYRQARTVSFTLETLPQRAQPVLVSVATDCESYECSGTTTRAMTYEDTATGPALKSAQNARGGYSVNTYTTPSLSLPTGIPSRSELTSQLTGASSSSGADPLSSTSYQYTYGSSGQTPRGWEQYVSEESTTSLLDAGTTSRRITKRDPSTNRVIAEFLTGLTSEFNPTTGGWTEVARVIGTFHFLSRKCTDDGEDSLGRTVETHGPCVVADTDATDCPATTVFPVTQRGYYEADAGMDAHRLQFERQWTSASDPSNCTGTSLTTTYAGYDVWGNPGQSVDPNGVTTTMTYVDGKLATRTIDGQTTTYEWDNDKLTAIGYPEGNFEVFCYRAASLGNACSRSLAPTAQLQWQAKAPNALGTSYTEGRAYFYLSDGRLTREEYWDGILNVKRRQMHFEENARGQRVRATRGVDGETPSFGQLSRFDPDGNLTGTTPALRAMNCGEQARPFGSGSSACANLRLDRLGRTISLDVAGATSGQTGRTCVAYDSRGNVASVKMGCPSDSTSYPGPDCGDCTQPALSWQSDDFGNVVSITMPHQGGSAGGGVTRLAYDAQGNPIYRQTPTMAAGTAFHSLTYDGLGRQLSVSNHRLSGTPASETLYSNVYDDSTAPGAGCPQPLRTAGRLRKRTDTFGDTWYQYSPAGLLLQEGRVRHGTTCSSALPRDVPSTSYTYTANGLLSSITYPYGRTVTYGYGTHSSVTTGRVSSISVTTWDGSAWNPWVAIEGIVYEPYGGLRAWQLNGASGELNVEAFPVPTSGPSLGACPIASPTTNDLTGRVSLLNVSSGELELGEGEGDVFQLYQEFDALKVTREARCWLQPSSAQIRTPTYHPGEQLLVSSGSYDLRGNRTAMASSFSDVYNDTFVYADGGVQDQLIQWARHSSTSPINYTYDLDGRLATLTLPNDSSGQPSYTQTWTGAGPLEQGSGGLDTVYKSVSVAGAVYEYYYDATNRRRLKEYPTGVTDEYFYSASNELLVDRGNAAMVSPSYLTTDDYVWLDGRPMLVVRGRLDASDDERAPDDTATCGRNGASEQCGAYFIISDGLPKPVALLDVHGKHARKLDWDFFGSLNRTQQRGTKTTFPYSHNTDWTFFQMSPSSSAGMSVEYRYQFDVLDTEGTAEAPVDKVEVKQAWQTLHALGGHHRGRVFSPWVTQDGGWISVSFKSGPYSCPPEGCLEDGGLPDGGSWPYTGVDLVAYELAERQTGARAFDIPLRFPGQYFDAETQMHENWNRFYDPPGGRYLSPEPLLQSPLYVRAVAEEGLGVPTYAYALNNPLGYIDDDGLRGKRPAPRPKERKGPTECPPPAPAGYVVVPELPQFSCNGEVKPLCVPQEYLGWSCEKKRDACRKGASLMGGACGTTLAKLCDDTYKCDFRCCGCSAGSGNGGMP